jgi:hypothetical protein
MASLKFERAVYLVSARIEMRPDDAPKTTFLETMAILKGLYLTERAFAALNDSDGVVDETVGLTPDAASKTNHDLGDVVYIADWREDAETKQTILLITRGDSNISSPAFVHSKDRGVRVAKPRKDEAPGHSCHVIFSHDPDKSGGHRVTIEKVANVSRTLVTRFLNSLLRTEAKRDGKVFDRRLGKPGIVKYHEGIDFAHHPGQSLERDIHDGRVTSITLIARNDEFAGPDALVRVKKVKRDLSLSIDYERAPERILTWLQSWLPGYARKENYDEVQIHIEGLNGGRSSASPTFALEKLEAAQTLYARTAIIKGFEKPLEQCEKECNQEVIRKMQEVHANDENWKS